MPDTRRTRRLLLCFGLCSALVRPGAHAGWSPAAAVVLLLALLLRLGLSPRFARTALLLALGLPFCALAQPPAAEGIAVQAGLTAKGEKRLLLVRPGAAAEPLTLVGPAISPFVGSRTADVAEIDAASCRTTRLWASAAEFLDAVRRSGANSVFCFAHNPWLPGEPEPLTGDPGRGEAAMAPDFVERLRSFGRECDRRGLVLQIAFFEHISVRHAAFQGLPSPLLPWLHAELERQGQPVDPMSLTAAFFRHTGKGPDGLSPIGRLQRAWIRALVQALPAASVVYEPVHEPRYRNNPYLEQRDVLAWQDWALGQIREAECDFGLPRHVLAVSPDPHGPRDGNHVVMEDLVAWREMQRHGVLPNFAQLDLVIVHGQPFFGKDLGAALHRRQLARSLGPFLRRFPELAFELSTDGLNGRSHFAPEAPCGGEDRGLSQLRHGVWGPVPTRAGPAEVYPLVWAQSVLEMDRAWGPGRVHFNNWSPTAASIDQIGQVFGRREDASRP